MADWVSLLTRPEDARGLEGMEDWFTRIASRLLNGSRLVAGGEPHRFVEIEFYYFGEGHTDPFTHRDPVQHHCGRWYFHRSRGVYKSGSFKGLDLSFGDAKTFGGVLIRGLETADGTLIDGPSLCVDHLLARAGAETVATLDAVIGPRPAWEAGNPLLLVSTPEDEARPIYRSPRVGLTLKFGRSSPEPARYVMRPYRYLTEPRRTRKGKLHVVLALHTQGMTPERIQELTGCPGKSVRQYLADFEAGRREKDFSAYIGKDLKPADLCRLYGTWYALHGGSGTA